MEDELLHLEDFRSDGAIHVARWVTKAWESGSFNWDLLCGGNQEDNIKERWALIRWLNDERSLDDLDVDDPDDREILAGILLSFAFHSFGESARKAHVGVQELLDSRLGALPA